MADYNLQYMNLKRQLQVIKIKLASVLPTNPSAYNDFLKIFDCLAKELDARYDEERTLSPIEPMINDFAIKLEMVK